MLPILDPTSTTAPTALAQPLALSDAARAQIERAPNLHGLLAQLNAAGLHVDAARLLLRALPKRYAVAWVCECFRKDAERAPFSALEGESIAVVERWIAEGSEEARAAANERAEASHYETATGWLAAAAAWSGGSLAPPGYTVVPPGEQLTGDACFAALCLLAAREPAAFASRLRGWLERAIKVFAGAPERA
jgi:hypothetical protein